MYLKIKIVFCLFVLTAFLLSGVAFAEAGTTDAKVTNKKAINNAADLKTGKEKLPAVSPDKSKAKMPPDSLGAQKAMPVEKPKTTSDRDKVSAVGHHGSDDGTGEPTQEHPNPMDSKSTPRATKAPVR